MAQIYGVFPVIEAIRARSQKIVRISMMKGTSSSKLEQIQKLAQQNKIPCQFESRESLNQLVKGANHQGVVAVISSPTVIHAEDVLDKLTKTSLLVLLDQIEDPHNLGAIIRTAECAGVQAIFIPEHRAVGLTDTVAKVSAGASEYIPVIQITNLVNLINDLKRRSIWVIGIEADGEKLYTEWDYSVPTAIVLGSEAKGIRRLVRENCDLIVSIPLCGQISSLNVSVATGVILYEAIRQKNKK